MRNVRFLRELFLNAVKLSRILMQIYGRINQLGLLVRQGWSVDDDLGQERHWGIRITPCVELKRRKASYDKLLTIGAQIQRTAIIRRKQLAECLTLKSLSPMQLKSQE